MSFMKVFSAYDSDESSNITWGVNRRCDLVNLLLAIDGVVFVLRFKRKLNKITCLSKVSFKTYVLLKEFLGITQRTYI